eukprot:1156139-Pelagomonas_calceolata.AAC.1
MHAAGPGLRSLFFSSGKTQRQMLPANHQDLMRCQTASLSTLFHTFEFLSALPVLREAVYASRTTLMQKVHSVKKKIKG